MTKQPIYPVEVIAVACRALAGVLDVSPSDQTLHDIMDEIQLTALRIIRDGLASHERAIKGET